MFVTFHGVRGSTPCQSDRIAKYGGNTSCVSIAAPGERPLLLDLGTGLRYFAETLRDDEPFRGTVLLSHLHWDHVQGLPFFRPLLREGAEMTVYAPTQDDGSHPSDALRAAIRPPLFPVHLRDLRGSVVVHRAKPEFSVGGYVVRSVEVPHNGATCGYRVDIGDHSLAYVCDHQQPADPATVDERVLELCRGVDLLIHDAQYTPEEFVEKQTWGHCTSQYAVTVAIAAGATRLALFHHDPDHDDGQVERMEADAMRMAASHGVEAFAAAEGMTVEIASR